MTQSDPHQIAYARAADSGWQGVYKIGAAAALIVALAALADVSSTLLPGGYVSSETVIDWFKLFQDNWLLGLRDLGLLDIIVTTLNVPLFLALFAAHRRLNKQYAALGAILSFVGTAVFTSNNIAFPMLALSGEYAAATTEAQKSLCVTTGEVMLAMGEHSSPGTFMGYFFTNVAGMTMGIVMLQGRVFSKLAGWTGILGFGSLLLFNVCAAFVPAIYDTVLIFAGIGGLLFVIEYILIAGRLLQLGRDAS
ncbi:MAG: DUF4386 family protein [Anaerolineae bacterium]|nr:DUF4386 family protein [Anaerolineae bacterium]